MCDTLGGFSYFVKLKLRDRSRHKMLIVGTRPSCCFANSLTCSSWKLLKYKNRLLNQVFPSHNGATDSLAHEFDPPQMYKRIAPFATSGNKIRHSPSISVVTGASTNPPVTPVGMSLQSGVTMQDGAIIYNIWYGSWNESANSQLEPSSALLDLKIPTLKELYELDWTWFCCTTSLEIALVKEVANNFSSGKIWLMRLKIIFGLVSITNFYQGINMECIPSL